MRVYLLNAPFYEGYVRCGRWQGGVARGGTLYYPIWLAYATGVLEKEYGNNVRLVDAPAWKWNLDQVIDDVKKFKPDIVVLDTNFSSISNEISVSKKIKENVEGVKTIIVGPPASQFADRILNNTGVDAVARFEYDFIVRDYVRAIESGDNLSKVLGLSYVDNGKIIHNERRPFISSEELNDIPFVTEVYKKHLHIKDYFLGHTLYPMVQIFTGRGCPNQCIFCSWPMTLMGRVYRARSVKNIVDEFEYVKNDLPEVKEIFIEDDTFTIDKARLRSILTELKDRNIKMTWSCNSRVDLDYDSMKLMKKAGCRLLDVGYESGNDTMLKTIKKGITTKDSRRFTADAKKARLMILCDVIIGMPGETKDTARQTINFVKEIKPNIAQFSVATPIPGTEFYNWVKINNYLLTDIEQSIDVHGFQKCIISYDNFNKDDIQGYVDRGLKEYYLSPSFVPVALNSVLRKNGLHELNVIAKSAFVFIRYIGRNKEKT